MTTPEDNDDRELAALIDEIVAERAAPDPEWTSQLDARVRDGFGRRDRGVGARLRAAGQTLKGSFNARPLAFGGVAASMLVAFVVTVTVVQLDGGSDGSAGGGEAAMPSSQSESSAVPPAEIQRNALGSSAADGGGAQAFDSRGASSATKAGPSRARKQDRDARLELRTRPADVRDVSDQAISIIESIGGVVLNSNLREQGERSSAQLRLRVPSGELDPTLDRLTDLATVASLNESVTDITAPFASAKDRLTDARAERRRLLDALGNAGDGEEAATLRKQIAKTRKRIARSESAFQRLVQRSRNSEIDLQIKGMTQQSSAAPGGGDGSWTVGEVLGDAANVLKATLGVLLISAAVLLPLALLAVPARFLYTRIRRHQREQALAGS